MKKTLKLLFIIAFFVVCIIPVGLMWRDTSTLSENRSLSEFPDWILDNGEWNKEFFDEFEIWLTEHFAFRGALVEADGALKYHVFASPSDGQVIIGKNEWLFFDETLNDYAGVTLAEDEIDMIADTLQKVCQYIEGLGKQPMIMLAPNKNTIYPELMPGRFGNKNEVSNRTLLQEALEERDVPYLDAAQVLIDYKATDEVYLHQDTHWNNTGARLVLNALYKAWDLKLHMSLQNILLRIHMSQTYIRYYFHRVISLRHSGFIMHRIPLIMWEESEAWMTLRFRLPVRMGMVRVY